MEVWEGRGEGGDRARSFVCGCGVLSHNFVVITEERSPLIAIASKWSLWVSIVFLSKKGSNPIQKCLCAVSVFCGRFKGQPKERNPSCNSKPLLAMNHFVLHRSEPGKWAGGCEAPQMSISGPFKALGLRTQGHFLRVLRLGPRLGAFFFRRSVVRAPRPKETRPCPNILASHGRTLVDPLSQVGTEK